MKATIANRITSRSHLDIATVCLTRLAASMPRSESTKSPTTSYSLLESVRSNDSASWSRLISIYGPLVYEWSRRSGLQSADAADVMQDVFRTVHSNLSQFGHVNQKSSFRGWLRTIHRSRMVDHLRRNNKEELLGSSDKNVPRLNSESLNNDRDEVRLLVNRALEVIREDFSEQTWEAFTRLAIAHQRPRDVATDLGMKPAAVCMSRGRVLKRLRETLADLGESEIEGLFRRNP